MCALKGDSRINIPKITVCCHIGLLVSTELQGCCCHLQGHKTPHKLGCMSVQEKPAPAAGGLSSTACSAWKPAAECLSCESGHLLLGAVILGQTSQQLRQSAAPGKHSAVPHGYPPAPRRQLYRLTVIKLHSLALLSWTYRLRALSIKAVS